MVFYFGRFEFARCRHGVEKGRGQRRAVCRQVEGFADHVGKTQRRTRHHAPGIPGRIGTVNIAQMQLAFAMQARPGDWVVILVVQIHRDAGIGEARGDGTSGQTCPDDGNPIPV